MALASAVVAVAVAAAVASLGVVALNAANDSLQCGIGWLLLCVWHMLVIVVVFIIAALLLASHDVAATLLSKLFSVSLCGCVVLLVVCSVLLVVVIALVFVLNSLLVIQPLVCVFASVTRLLCESVNEVAELIWFSKSSNSEIRKCIQ